MIFRPGLEQIEERQLLSAGSLATVALNAKDSSGAVALRSAGASGLHGAAADITASHAGQQTPNHHRRPTPPGTFGYLAFRVTNTPYQTPYKLVPPFQQVLVQGRQPVPGQVYNVNDVAVKNGTSQTFNASSGFTVRMTNQPRSFAVPILTGKEQWKPGQVIVLYVLTKKYYPVSFVAGGFQLDLGGRSSTLVPGPSAIFLRLKYDPATFARALDWIVAYGQGNEGGLGSKYGLPNSSINEIVDATTRRSDFAGHF
jgi:hypothetical protein